MTNTNESGIKLPLGVIGIIGESFSIFFRRFFLFFSIAVLAQIILYAVNYLLTGGQSINFGLGLTPGATGIPQNWLALSVSTIISLLGNAVVVSMISLAAFDVKTGASTSIIRYFSQSIKHIIPITVLMIVTTVLFAIPIGLAVFSGYVFPASMLVAIPLAMIGVVYLMSLFSLIYPAIVIEDAGFGALGRSRELTAGYRLRIIGLYLLLFLGIFIFMAIVGAVIAFSLSSGGVGTGTLTTGVIFTILLSTFVSAYFSIIVVMLFARLKEIKEGYGFENVGAVFD